MGNKYYSPQIEELHIGFECEIDQSEINKNFKWCEYVIGTDYETITISRAISEVNKNGIRVKYLDRQDIESFGFKYYDKIEDSIYFKYKSFRLAFNPIANKVEIVEFGPCHFRGSIKNKSELKVILKQIGIINE